jgi:hypothetical protein
VFRTRWVGCTYDVGWRPSNSYASRYISTQFPQLVFTQPAVPGYLDRPFPSAVSCRLSTTLYPTMSTNAFETSMPELPEKTMKAQHADGATTPSTMEAAEGPLFDAARTKKLLRKMDWHLVPFLALLYL